MATDRDENPIRNHRRGLMLLDLLLVLSLLIALLAWLFDPLKLSIGPVPLSVSWGLKSGLAPVLLVALRAFLTHRAATAERPAPRPALLLRLALALAATLILLVGLDAGLALVGAVPETRVFELREADGTAIKAGGAMVHDAGLLWRFEPGAHFRGRKVNNLGFLGPDAAAQKARGTRRIVCMGDSCTAQGVPPYSVLLQNLFQQAASTGATWETLNAAVHGYTLVQGLVLFDRHVRALQPDVVTLFYGWNDHWLERATDSERMARASSSPGAVLYRALSRKRLHVLLRATAPSTAPRRVRVPHKEYEQALHALLRNIRRAGALPVVITAPRAETLTGRLVHNHAAASVAEAIRLHDQYVELTRRVAGEERALLIDLAAEFTGPAHAELFSDDGIHFTNAGRQRIAERIFQELGAQAIQRSTP